MNLNKIMIVSSIILILATQISSLAAKDRVDQRTVNEAKPIVSTYYDALVVEAPPIVNMIVMNVVVYNEQNEEVLNIRSMGEPAQLMTTGMPDGEYHYRAVTIFQLDNPTGQGADYEAEGSSRQSGSIRISNGQVSEGTQAFEKTESEFNEQSSLMNTIIEKAVNLAGVALDVLVPSAHAQDLTAKSTIPVVWWDDSSFPSCCDFGIYANLEDATHGTWTFRDLLSANTHNVISIKGIAGDDLNERAMEIDANGDIHWSDGGMHLNWNFVTLSLGWQSTSTDFSISAPTPDIRLHDSSDTSEAEFELSNGLATFWGRPSDGAFWNSVMRYSTSAPDDSFAISSSGNVGIGTDSPTVAVDVERSGKAANFRLTSYTNASNQAPQYIQRRARGTVGAPMATGNGDQLGLVSFRGHTGAAFSSTRAAISAKATEPWTPASNGTQITFATTANGTTNIKNRMIITSEGEVLIIGQLLEVPDYVFEEDYQLMSLDELSDYIKRNKHLPGVASADEVHSNGLNVANSQLSVLEKVEELTLYTLQQHEALKQLGSINAALKKRLAIMESQQTKIQAVLAKVLENQQEHRVLTSTVMN